MGRLAATAVAAAQDLELVALFGPGGESAHGLEITNDPTALSEADVVVEFTNPDVVMDNLAAWRDMGLHTVVGTSGFDAARLATVEAEWGSGPPNCIIAPNFSIGAVLLMHFAERAAAHMPVAEIVELHHEDKPDAPSGTALATAQRMADARKGRGTAFQSKELVAGARGADVDGIPVHSIRLPGIIASQEVVLGVDGETLSMRHDTFDRESFMPGVLLAVRAIADRPGVTFGLESLLGI